MTLGGCCSLWMRRRADRPCVGASGQVECLSDWIIAGLVHAGVPLGAFAVAHEGYTRALEE